MQAAVQKHIDSSISKTINVPAEIPFERFKDVYLQAYALGCKGCTTYRPNEVTGAVLEVQEGAAAPTAAAPAAELPLPPPAPQPRQAGRHLRGGRRRLHDAAADRPEALPGQTYKIRWPDSEHALYITSTTSFRTAGAGRSRSSSTRRTWSTTPGRSALTRMISAVFRRGGDVSFVVEEMKAVFDPRGGAWMEGRYVPSLLAAIGDVIERHMIEIGFLPSQAAAPTPSSPTRQVVNLRRSRASPSARAHGAMPEMRRGGADPHRRLRPVHQLRLFEMRLNGA